jgi:hypothetical protein
LITLPFPTFIHPSSSFNHLLSFTPSLPSYPPPSLLPLLFYTLRKKVLLRT